jgi:hypothetical protein
MRQEADEYQLSTSGTKRGTGTDLLEQSDRQIDALHRFQTSYERLVIVRVHIALVGNLSVARNGKKMGR